MGANFSLSMMVNMYTAKAMVVILPSFFNHLKPSGFCTYHQV